MLGGTTKSAGRRKLLLDRGRIDCGGCRVVQFLDDRGRVPLGRKSRTGRGFEVHALLVGGGQVRQRRQPFAGEHCDGLDQTGLHRGTAVGLSVQK